MITSIEIDNFKCFRSLRLDLGSLTLLTGYNGAGKSTAIQPLLLLAQGLRSARPDAFAINGSLIRLGTAGDLLPANSDRPTIGFGVRTDSEAAMWSFAPHAGDRFLRAGTADEAPGAELAAPSHQKIESRLRRLTFVSAVREGQAEAFPAPEEDSERLRDVGPDGRFAAYWYERYVDDIVPEQRRHPSEPASSFRKQLDAWLATLFAGANVNVQALLPSSLFALQFRTTEFGEWHRPANVGYGFSYALPILVALLSADEGQLVIIDSPEAHLHPSAQSQMGRILAHFARADVQIIVETHSDHLLNGARLAVREGSIEAGKVRIHFFTGATATGNGILSPSLDGSGRVDAWPEGFFDQSERDLARLAGWDA
jgi:predicted ATPase